MAAADNDTAPITKAVLRAVVKSEVRAVVKSEVRAVVKSEVRAVVKAELTTLRAEFATKAELKEFRETFARFALETQANFEAAREHADAGFRRLTGTIDAFVKNLQRYDRESIWIPEALRNQRLQLEDHEKRIGRLEHSAP